MWFLRALAIAAPLTGLHVVVMALVASAVGAVLLEVRIFLGPSFALRRAHPRIAIGLIPAGGFVTIHGMAGIEDTAEGVRFDALPRWRRALVLVSGNLALLVVAMIALGPMEALASAGRTIPQLLSLVLAPSDAAAAVRAFADMNDVRWILGTLAAKVATFNMLPILSLNGEAIARLAIPRGRHPRIDHTWSVLSLLATLAIFGGLVVALWRA